MLERRMQTKGSKSGAADSILKPVTCKIKSRRSIPSCVQLLVSVQCCVLFKPPSAAIFMASVFSSPSLSELLSGSFADRQLTVMPAAPLREVMKLELFSHTQQ